ncbi:MAG: efflux RND transporter permease subunit [Methyloversatilis discipulorum]|uniref:efflux RND transporter permease subunit n=1 Tax=Methyloversatilis discipulorum TaxID=1119528 RepID=UPI0026F03116|nr:CusA/CzcA family heavy metal efflux RND transporter [Methyloversatilis discipulorum]MBV5287819.1 efflux RND transporter permease subunit [Methyloversatilis discipulorum]
MLDALTRSALARPLLTVLAALLLIAAGLNAAMNLPIDAFPDVSAPQVKIIVKLPGMTPEEMEARVTTPIEIEMLGLPKQTMLRSTSKYGLTDVTIDFEDGTDIYWARNQVSERLNGIMGDLPPGLSGGLAPITTPLGEMFMFTIEGDLPIAERRALLDWVIRPALRTVRGVADVNVLGGLASAYEVVPDAARMAATGITLDELRTTLERFNRNDGAGRINEGEETLLVRVQGRLTSLDDIGRLVVHATPTAQVRVADVAEVKLGALTRMGGVTHNGEGETVQGLVLGLRGADAQQVVAGVRARLEEVQAALPAGVTVVPFYDRGELVSRAVGTVSKALLEAVVLVGVMLYLFLGNLRAALAVAVVLPLSALWTFLLMRQFGLSANLMSLGGLAIAIGLLVDAAVVVVENVVAHLHEPGADQRPRQQVVLDAVREVAVPTTAGIVIIALVFVPLLSLQGLEGKLFAPVALTIVFALAGSLLLSLTVIPLLARLMLNAKSHADPWLPRTLARLYAPLLQKALAAPAVVGVVAGLLGVAAVVLYMGLGKTFMPTMDEGSLIVQLEKLPSISLDASLAIDTQFQRALKEKVPEAQQVVARAGSDEIGLDPMGLNQTDTFISLPTEVDKPAVIHRIRELLNEFPGVAYAFTQPIEMRVSEMILGVRGDLAIRIFGPDLDVLNRKAEEIAEVLRATPGAEDVFFVRNEGVQYLRVVPDNDALARAGLDIDTLAASLRAQIEGERVGLIQQQERRIPLLVRASGSTAAADELAQMPVALPGGGRIALGQLARFERVGGPVQINRQLGSRNMVVIANVGGRDLVGFVEEARAQVMQKVELPPGYRLTWGGEFENQQRAAQRLALVVPVALVLIFLILYSTFDSLRQATLVMANVPFAMIGGVFALALSGEYLSVPASVGFIALLGIAVLNGVVLVSYFNQLRATGLSMLDAVVHGAQRRLRPVLLTASMAALGLVPLLFATGPGSEIQRPLAIVVIGGLVSCTALTLLLLPILYKRFGERSAIS